MFEKVLACSSRSIETFICALSLVSVQLFRTQCAVSRLVHAYIRRKYAGEIYTTNKPQTIRHWFFFFIFSFAPVLYAIWSLIRNWLFCKFKCQKDCLIFCTSPRVYNYLISEKSQPFIVRCRVDGAFLCYTKYMRVQHRILYICGIPQVNILRPWSTKFFDSENHVRAPNKYINDYIIMDVYRRRVLVVYM